MNLDALVQRLADRHGVDLDALKIRGTEPDDFCSCPKPEGCYGQYGWHFQPQEGVIWGVVAYEKCPRYAAAVQRASGDEDKAIGDLLTAAGIPPGYLGMTLQRWRGEVPIQVRRFLAEPSGFLVISGRAGTGKTHLGVAVAAELAKRSLDIAWIDTQHFLAEMKRDRFHWGDQQVRRLKYADLAVLDDLGAERGTEFDLSTLAEVIRYRHTQSFATVVTSNLSLLQVQARDERVASRLWSGLVVERGGVDQRVGS